MMADASLRRPKGAGRGWLARAYGAPTGVGAPTIGP